MGCFEFINGIDVSKSEVVPQSTHSWKRGRETASGTVQMVCTILGQPKPQKSCLPGGYHIAHSSTL